MTPLELSAFSGLHLRYEIDMFLNLGRRAPELRRQAIDATDQSAIVESYAMHLRNLIDFLYADPRETT